MQLIPLQGPGGAHRNDHHRMNLSAGLRDRQTDRQTDKLTVDFNLQHRHKRAAGPVYCLEQRSATGRLPVTAW